MRGKWDVACRGSPHSVQFYAEWDGAASRLPHTGAHLHNVEASRAPRPLTCVVMLSVVLEGEVPLRICEVEAPVHSLDAYRVLQHRRRQARQHEQRTQASPSAIGRARRRDGQPGAGVGSPTTRSACSSPSAHDARAPRRRVPRRRRAAPESTTSPRRSAGGAIAIGPAAVSATNERAAPRATPPHPNATSTSPSRSHSVCIGAMWDDTARRSHRNVTETALKGHSQVAQTRSHEHRCPCPEAS